ncbi:MAG: arylsulfotransferase family protein [Kiloniellales bacterium]
MSTKLGFAGFFIAALFLAFVGGAVVMASESFPYEIIHNAYRAGEALWAKETDYDDPLKTDLWKKARRPEIGVTLYRRDRAVNGYTLYTSGTGPHARLIAMDGTVVQEWVKPYSEIWTEAAAVDDPQPDNLLYMRKGHVFRNGDLLAIYEAVGDTPWGYGMVKLDRESDVLWSYLEHTHHDFDVGEDGQIYALIHAFTSESIEHYEALERPRLDDYLVVLSPDGKELKRVSLTHALIRSRFKGMLYSTPFFALGDPLHTNAVEVIDAANVGNFPFGRPGQVLLSFRELGVIAVLDIEREEIVWATRGPWVGQHDPSLLANGNILLFDNLGVFEEGNTSQVIELNPSSMEIVWRYRGDRDHPFDSPIRSAAERLPNGNTLITESDGGRLFEVTRQGEIVWEYLNPVRAGENDDYIPVVSWGQRIDPDTLDPEFRDLLAEHVSPSQ